MALVTILCISSQDQVTAYETKLTEICTTQKLGLGSPAGISCTVGQCGCAGTLCAVCFAGHVYTDR